MSVEEVIIKDDSLRYESEEVYYGEYKHIQVYPDEGTNGQTVDSGGGVQHSIPIGSQYVWNPAESHLNLQVCVPTSTNYNWTYADVLGLLRDCQLVPESGQNLVNIQDVAVYQKLSNRYLNQFEEFQTFDADWVDSTDGFNRSSSVPFYPANKEQSRNKLAPNGNDAALPYKLAQYCFQSQRVSGGSNNPATSYALLKIPLRFFKNCLLSMNKNIWFGQQVNLVLTYEGLTKWLWDGTSATNPSTGAAVTGSASVNIQAWLDLAVQQDQGIVAQIKQKVASEGMQMLVPFVQRVYKTSLSGTSQNISNVTLSRSNGLRLLRIWYGIFNGTQQYNTYLDNYNLATSSTVKGKVDNFQTFIDGIPIQVKAMYSGGIPSITQANNDDYKLLKNRIRGSCIQSMIDYYQNWFWVDDFTQPMPRSSEEKDIPFSNKLQGFHLDDAAQHTWMNNLVVVNGTYMHYVYVETLRVLKIAPGMISLI